jgi:PBSX family phage portal protein
MVQTTTAPPSTPELDVTIVKAAPKIDVDFGRSREDADEIQWGISYPLDPPLDVDRLLFLFSVSDTLQQCVDSMVANIDARGWVPEPVLDLDADDAAEQVATAMFLERRSSSPSAQLPTEGEVASTMQEWRREAKLEKALLKLRINSLCYETTFSELRQQQRRDREVIGWGAWEIIRNEDGQIVRAKHVPSRTLRLTVVDDEITEVDEWISTSEVSREVITVDRRFRRVIQMDSSAQYVYFKWFGDPRIVSPKSGKAYTTMAELKEADATPDGEQPKTATEILWFGAYYPEGAYPQPRWHGLIPNIVGSREASEDNAKYLSSSAIPQGLLLVSDGRVGQSSKGSLSTFFDAGEGQARQKIALVEATTPRENAILPGSGRVQIEWVSLRQAQQDDLTFSQYIDMTSDQVGESFRLPSLLRGKVKDINKATAVSALEFAEDQVFAPERQAFDDLINTTLLENWGIRFWRFKSLGSRKRDPESISNIARAFVHEGVVTPAELRPLAEQLLGVDLPSAASEWQHITQQMISAGHMPPALKAPETVQPDGAPTPAEEPEPESAPGSVEAIAKQITKLEAVFMAAKAAEHMAQLPEYDGTT